MPNSELTTGKKVESFLGKGALVTGATGAGFEVAGLAIGVPLVRIALLLGVSWAGLRFFFNPRRQTQYAH